MSRNTNQLVNLLLRLVKTSDGKVSWLRILVLGAALLLYVFFQPTLERTLGIDLPDITTETPNTPAPNDRIPSSRSPSSQPSTQEAIRELSKFLEPLGRDSYRSPAGLRYTRGSEHGHRIAHIMAHTHDEPNQPGQHGVFDAKQPLEVFQLIDNAYQQALLGDRTDTNYEDERTIYTVNLGKRIGYIGGTSGKHRNHPTAKYLRLVVERDRLITAFPYRP